MRRLATAGVLFALLAPAGAESAQRFEEPELKAAFLYNFTKFVDWPPGTWESAEAPFRICLLGADEVSAVLGELVTKEAVKGRTIEVLRYRRLRDARGCQILFLAAGAEPDGLAAQLADTRGEPVLTVGETEAFLRAGGMVRFRMETGRIRLEVNDRVRERSPLKLSSKLLQLCDLVTPETETGPRGSE